MGDEDALYVGDWITQFLKMYDEFLVRLFCRRARVHECECVAAKAVCVHPPNLKWSWNLEPLNGCHTYE